MGIEKKDVNELRETIKGCVGQKVLLRGSLGRNKSLNIEGTLMSAHHDYFLIKSDDGPNKQSNTYVDVLTNSVELSIGNSENYTSILDMVKPNTNNIKENL
ncbi:MAG: Veg family protein [Clostridia bacterium]|nr:Veg family protein [Clostridia bacterium]